MLRLSRQYCKVRSITDLLELDLGTQNFLVLAQSELSLSKSDRITTSSQTKSLRERLKFCRL